jgi:Tfp pilus assembly protein PilV
MELHHTAVKEETGFSAVEMLLSLIIVVMITFVGYYIYNTQKNADATYKAASTVASASVPKKVAASKKFALSYSKLAFTYPSNWKLANSSEASGPNDAIDLSSASNARISIYATSLGHKALDYKPAVRFSEPIKFAGVDGYLDYWGNSDTTSVSDVSLSTSSTDPLSSFQHIEGSVTFNMSVDGGFPAAKEVDVATAKKDTGVAVLKQIIASAHY